MDSLSEARPRQTIITFLLCFRITVLLYVAMLGLIGVKTIQIWPFILAVFYNISLLAFRHSIIDKLRARPYLLFIDIIVSFLLVLASGGYKSPYYFYNFSPLVLGAFLFGYAGAFILAGSQSVLYLTAVYANGHMSSGIISANQSIIADIFFFFLAGVSFAYLKDILDQLDVAEKAETAINLELKEANRRLEIHLKASKLSDREIQTLMLSIEGQATDEISEILGLSKNTIKTYLNRAYRKLNAGSKTEAYAEILKQVNHPASLHSKNGRRNESESAAETIGIRSKRANLLHLLIVRWVALFYVVLLYALGIKIGTPILFFALVFYSLLLTLFWHRMTHLIKKYPAIMIIDLTISGISIWLTGGTWQSPYYLYAFTSILITSFFSHIKGGVIAAGCLTILYTTGLVINKYSISKIAANIDLDTFISNYLAFFLVAIFFGYPAQVIHKIENTKRLAEQKTEQLDRIKEITDVTKRFALLSRRELEIFSALNKGKTNQEIAEELHVVESTVKSHLYRIYKKLDVSSRDQALLHFHNKVNTNNDKNR